MANGGGTLARLSIAIGLETSGILSGMLLARKQMLGGLAAMQAEADAAGAHAKSNLLSVGNVAAGVVAGIAVVGAGLVDLAVKYEAETAAVAAAMGTSTDDARKIVDAFVADSGRTIYTAQEVTTAWAQVAGQADTTAGHVLNASESMTIMSAAENLAGSTHTDLTKATASLTEVMQAYSMPVSDAAKASDILFKVSKNLNEPIDQVGTTFARLHGALGPLAPSLKDTATLLEEAATKGFDMTRNQRFLNQFITGIQHLTNANPDIAKLTTAQNDLAKANANLDKVTDSSGARSVNYVLDRQREVLAQERFNAAVGKYGINSIQANAAQVAWNSAQVKVSKDITGNSTAIADAQQKVADAQAKVDAATGPAAGILQKYGLHLYDANKQFVGMKSVLEQLHPAFAKMTDAQRLAAATDLFGAKSASQMIPLIMAGSAGWDQYSQDLGKAGAAAQGYATATDNIGDQWKRVVGFIQGQGTQLSKTLEPFVKGLLEWANTHLPEIAAGFQKAFGVIGSILSGVWAVLHPMLQFIIDHKEVLIAFLVLFALKWAVIKGLNLGKEILGWTTALKDFGTKGITEGLKGVAAKPYKDIKSAWSDMMNAPGDYHTSKWASGIRGSISDTQAFERELGTLKTVGTDSLSHIASLTKAFPEDMAAAFKSINMPKIATMATFDAAGLAARMTEVETKAAEASALVAQRAATRAAKTVADEIAKTEKAATSAVNQALTDSIALRTKQYAADKAQLMLQDLRNTLPDQLQNAIDTALPSASRDIGSAVGTVLKSELNTAASDFATQMSVLTRAYNFDVANLKLEALQTKLASVETAAMEQGAKDAAVKIGTNITPSIANAVDEGITSAITKPRNALGQFIKVDKTSITNDISTAVADAEPRIADAFKIGTSNVGSTIATDVENSLSKSGILSKLPSVAGNVLGKFTALASQPVWIVGANPGALAAAGLGIPGLGGGGGPNIPGIAGETGGIAALGELIAGLTVPELVAGSLAVVGVLTAIGLMAHDLSTNPNAKPRSPAGKDNYLYFAQQTSQGRTLEKQLYDAGVPMDQIVKDMQAFNGVMQAFNGNINPKQIDLIAQELQQGYTTTGALVGLLKGALVPAASVGQGFNNIITGTNNVTTQLGNLSTALKIGSPAWVKSAASAVGHGIPSFGLPLPHSAGGTIGPGEWGTVGEEGPELAYGGRTGLSIIPGMNKSRIVSAQGSRRELNVGAITVNNPLPEPASVSIQYQLRNLSMLGFSAP